MGFRVKGVGFRVSGTGFLLGGGYFSIADCSTSAVFRGLGLGGLGISRVSGFGLPELNEGKIE